MVFPLSNTSIQNQQAVVPSLNGRDIVRLIQGQLSLGLDSIR
jgi:hypothetical protein